MNMNIVGILHVLMVFMVVTEGSAGLIPVAYNVISNVSVGATDVSPIAQLLLINPNANAPFPTNMTVGTDFRIKIDVDNPNPTTINGYIMLNLTCREHNVTANDIYVYSGNTDHGLCSYAQLDGITANTLTYKIYAGQGYFPFWPGLTANVTWISIQYNVPGQYEWSLAVYQ